MICGLTTFTKASRFEDLAQSVQHCDLCPRLCGRRKVLSAANGNTASKVLFIAEAPGRLGAERTGIPLHGDRTGDNFESLLGNVGWKREDVFITNALLCNPQDDDGTNGTPTQDELANCSAYLEMVINLVQPQVVVTLGATALDALSLISAHGITLRDGVAKVTPWQGVQLFPLYHPGPRATVHRSLAKQRSDFMVLAKMVHPTKGLQQRSKPRPQAATQLFAVGTSPLQQVARVLLDMGGRMTFFKLTKLLYLVDLTAIERIGQMVAADVYLRQVEGPWAPKLDQAIKEMEGFEVRRFFAHKLPMVTRGPSARSPIQLDDDVLEIIAEVFEAYGHMTNAEIKTAVYHTKPMRHVLMEERKGKDMRNKAVLYKNKTIADETRKMETRKSQAGSAEDPPKRLCPPDLPDRLFRRPPPDPAQPTLSEP